MSYDKIYQEGIYNILTKGENVPTRAKLESTGKKIGARSLLGYHMDFCIHNPESTDHGKLPLLTCKQVNWKPMLRELLWMISGSTNVKDLHKDNVHIWDQWAGPDGELGPVYGAAWRRYEGVGGTFDQLGRAIEGIRCVVKDPTESVGRRLIVNAWDPTRISEMKLPPCHCFFQFFVRGSLLHLSLYQRSADAFLGVPFNIASYATLLMMVAQVTGLKPGTFMHRFGDFHLCENHIDQAFDLITRGNFPSPSLVLDPACKEIDDFKFESFELVGYNHMGPMRGEVAVLCHPLKRRSRPPGTCRSGTRRSGRGTSTSTLCTSSSTPLSTRSTSARRTLSFGPPWSTWRSWPAPGWTRRPRPRRSKAWRMPMAAKKASKPRKKHVDRTKSVESGKGGGYNISDFRWSDVVPMAPEVKKDPHIPHPLGDG